MELGLFLILFCGDVFTVSVFNIEFRLLTMLFGHLSISLGLWHLYSVSCFNKICLPVPLDFCLISVKDTGEGIDINILPRLFTKFASSHVTGLIYIEGYCGSPWW